MVKVSHDSETQAHGKQVISVCAVIWHDFDGVKKIFLPRRATTKKFLPGVFEVPGGHVDFGEDLIEGLKREIKEEFNMAINVGEPFNAFTYMNNIKGSHSVQVDFLATFAEPFENIKLEPEDHSEFGWFSLDEIRAIKNITDESKRNALRALEIVDGGTLKLE